MAAPKSLGNLALEIPDGTDEKEHRRLLNERMLLISEELSKLNQPKPLEISADLDLQGHRLVNVGDPDKKINSRGVSVAVTADQKGETQQLKNALTVEFGDARYLRRRNTAEDRGTAATRIRLLTVTLPSVREDDIGLRARLKETMSAAVDLKEIKVDMAFGEGSHLGDSFEPGDFFLLSDETKGQKRYNYECCRLLRIILPKSTDDLSVSIRWIIQRRPPDSDDTEFDLTVEDGDTSKQAWFGSSINIHAEKTLIFKLQMKREHFDLEGAAGVPNFTARHFKNGVVTIDDLKFGPPDPALAALENAIGELKAAGKEASDEQLAALDALKVIEHDRAHSLDIEWSHRCIVAAILQLDDSKTEKITTSLMPKLGDPKEIGQQPRPGLRTHSGASYTLVRSGDLAVNDRIRVPIHVAEWPALRCIYAYLKTAPAGVSLFGQNSSPTAFILDAVFVAPPEMGVDDDKRIASIITRFQWNDGDHYTYSPNDPPDRHFMPYQKWGAPKNNWPTTLLFGKEGLDSLIVDDDPPTDQDLTQIVRQDGYLDFIVRQVGTTTPGADLCVEILL